MAARGRRTWVWTLTLLPALLQGQDAPSLQWSCFGTLAAAQSTTDQVGFLRDLGEPGPGITRRLNTEADSRVGFQLNAQFTQTLRADFQVVSKYRYDGTFRPEVTRACLDWNPVHNLEVRVGRVGLDQILGTDSRDAGFSYLWVRPNIDLFGLKDLESIQGVDIAETFSITPSTTLKLKVVRGDGTDKLAFNNTLPVDMSYVRVTGGYGEVHHGHWSARLWTTRSQFQSSWPIVANQCQSIPDLNALLQKNPKLAQLVQAASTPGSMLTDWQASWLYEKDPIQILAALSRAKADAARATARWTGLWSIGYRLGAVVPYGVFSRSVSGYAPPPQMASALKAAFPTLQADFNLENSLLQTDQNTYACGVRWDFSEKADLKFQVDQIHSHQGFGGWHMIDPSWNGRATIFTVTLDFVLGRGR